MNGPYHPKWPPVQTSRLDPFGFTSEPSRHRPTLAADSVLWRKRQNGAVSLRYSIQRLVSNGTFSDAFEPSLSSRPAFNALRFSPFGPCPARGRTTAFRSCGALRGKNYRFSAASKVRCSLHGLLGCGRSKKNTIISSRANAWARAAEKR